MSGVSGAGARVPAGTVRIFDTTLRDGEQAPGAGLTAAEKLEVARQLARLKVDVIEAGFPAASPGDWEAVHRIAKETKGVAVAALARCRDGDPQRAIEAIRVAERPHQEPISTMSPCGAWRMTSMTACIFSSCLLYTSPSPRDRTRSRMPSSA